MAYNWNIRISDMVHCSSLSTCGRRTIMDLIHHEHDLEERYFTIHGLVTFKTWGVNHITNYIHNVYQNFRCPQRPVDFIIKKTNDGFTNIQKHKGSWWSHIKDGDKIEVNGDPFISHRFIFRYVVEAEIIERLTKKGYVMLHSSCSAIDGRGVVRSGFPGSGKTTDVLTTCHNGAAYMSDDYTILKKDKIYSYPTSVRLMWYTVKKCPWLWDKLLLTEKFELCAKTLVSPIGKIPIDINPFRLVETATKTAKLEAINITNPAKLYKINYHELPEHLKNNNKFLLKMEKNIHALKISKDK